MSPGLVPNFSPKPGKCKPKIRHDFEVTDYRLLTTGYLHFPRASVNFLDTYRLLWLTTAV